MRAFQFALVSCIFLLLVSELNAQVCSSSSHGTLNGLEVAQDPIVMPPTQNQYTITVPQNACAPYQLVGMYVEACSNDDSLSVHTSDPWNALVTRRGVIRGNADVYWSIFCS